MNPSPQPEQELEMSPDTSEEYKKFDIIKRIEDYVESDGSKLHSLKEFIIKIESTIRKFKIETGLQLKRCVKNLKGEALLKLRQGNARRYKKFYSIEENRQRILERQRLDRLAKKAAIPPQHVDRVENNGSED